MKLFNAFFFLAFLFALSCKSTGKKTGIDKVVAIDSLLARKQNCALLGEPEIVDTSKYTSAWNAAYAYDYIYPRNFKDTSIQILDSEGTITSDTVMAISPDRHAVLKFWIGESISIPQDSMKVDDILRVDNKVDSFIREVQQSNYPYLPGFSIDTLCHGINGYYHNIALVAHNEKQYIVYKVEFSILPVTGNLIGKNLVFIYDKDFANIYHSIGITMANNFGFAKFYEK